MCCSTSTRMPIAVLILGEGLLPFAGAWPGESWPDPSYEEHRLQTAHAAQTALADTFSLPATALSASAPNLRTLLLSGDFFLGGVIAGDKEMLSPDMPDSLLTLLITSPLRSLRDHFHIAFRTALGSPAERFPARADGCLQAQAR